MSITFPTIIDADDYRAFQTGNNSPVNDYDIESAINTTFIQLNGICNNQIMLRWDLTEGEEMLNQTQKDLIIQAFLLQTKYNLDYDNDTSEGSVQSSFGANSYSSTRPRRDKITQDVLNLLNKAGVYSQVTVSSVTRSPYSPLGAMGAGYYPPLDSYVTIEQANSRFVPKFWSQALSGKYLYINENGIVDTTTGGGATWGSITGTLSNQTDLQNELDDLEDYCDNLDATKADATDVINLLGNEAVSGEPYHFTYYIDTQLNGYDLTTTLYTITLDNNKTLRQYSKTITLPHETSYVSKTYSELKDLRDNSQLVPGTYYRITDYVATTNGYGAGTANYTQSADHPFDLVVYATANNKLQENCYAIQHSGDTYFANSELLSWNVWYCLDNDTARFEWADSTNGKGVIYYLKDEFNNSAWYDFKGIQVKNANTSDRFYYLFDNSGADASMSASTAFPRVYGNDLGFYIYSNKYSIGCNIFTGNSFFNNTIGNNFYYNTIGNYFYYNTIGNHFRSNTIGNSFSNNTIGNNFNSNTIGNNFYYNTIGNNFNSNTIGNSFSSNTIGNIFQNNTIGTVSTNIYYQNNNFGDGIEYVDITDYGTSSAKKSGISLPSGLAGTSSSHKSITSLTNNTTYYLSQQQIS